MALEVGSRLGHYDVTALIGEGGMGQVYQATDTKLKRQVALKILPEAFSADPERLARFQREAEVLASLNHPNIAAIHGLEEADDIRALVLELVEGPTLADRIAKGPIPLDEALPIAKQIAEALEAAHEAGVIHRDLKPANIKVRDDGTVKVLDFGLAKALDPTPEGDPSQSPTLTAAATQMGVIMGTAAYMSPEQAAGKPVDKRGDIWSFGVVLFEMLTGDRVFKGETVSHVLGGVLRVEPDWGILPSTIPQSVRQLLRRCLRKDRARRLHDIADARLDLDDVVASYSSEEAAVATAQPLEPWRALRLAVAALTVGSVITGLAVWSLTRTSSPTPRVIRSSIMLPSSVSLGNIAHHQLALSPDGTDLVYAGNDQLYLRAVDQLGATPILGTEGAVEPFFSPDGQWIGYWADDQLKKVAVSGGLPLTICECENAPLSASWGPNDTILFSTGAGIWRVPGAGGTPEIVIPAEENGELLRAPQFLPGGEWILFSGNRQIAIESLVTGERRVLVDHYGDVRHLPTGHLVYVRSRTLMAVPFDTERLIVTGSPVPLVEGIQQGGNGIAQFAYANDGTLVYIPQSARSDERTLVYETGGVSVEAPRTLVLVNRNGEEKSIGMPPRAYRAAQLSPDGRRLVVDTLDDGELYLYNLDTQVEARFTFNPGGEQRRAAIDF